MICTYDWDFVIFLGAKNRGKVPTLPFQCFWGNETRRISLCVGCRQTKKESNCQPSRQVLFVMTAWGYARGEFGRPADDIDLEAAQSNNGKPAGTATAVIKRFGYTAVIPGISALLCFAPHAPASTSITTNAASTAALLGLAFSSSFRRKFPRLPLSRRGLPPQSSADDFFLQCNGKPFNSFEEAVCRVVFVATVTFDLASPASSPSPTSARVGAGAAATLPASAFDASATPTSSGNPSAATPPPPPPSMRPALLFSPISGSGGHASGGGGVAKAGAAAGVGGGGILSPEEKAAAAATVADAAWEYDAATCVICMDRMESRVLTTVCNHSFHVECLMKWQDSPCPVCRFHHNNASEASTCQARARREGWVPRMCVCQRRVCGCSNPLLDSSS